MRWSIPGSYTLLCLALVAASGLALTMGPMQLASSDSLLLLVDKVFGSQFSQLKTHEQVVVWQLRLPRLLLALLVGALLAQSGAVMQGLFRNPLADPGIIGVSSGAAVGAVLAIVFIGPQFALATPVGAFVGGLLTTLLVYRIARTENGTSVFILLLGGVAIAAFGGAIIGFLSYFSDDSTLRAISLWQMGTLAQADAYGLWLCLTALVLCGAFFQIKSSALNALLLGEAEARHMGINVEGLKLQLIIVTAVAVGIAVANSGIIGFVGLVVPHLVRLTTGPDHRTLLPLAAMAGAVLLLFADTQARLWVAPAELPVGLVTAMLGAPFFMLLLLQQRNQHI